MICKSFIHEGKPYAVMFETDGKWKGYVHIADGSLRKIGNKDILVSGARWDGTKIVASNDDFMEARGRELIAPATRALRSALWN